MAEITRDGRKRKTKNNKFLSRARKKMREGRTEILDQDTYEYFLRIGESMKGTETPGTDLSTNVLQETKGCEWEVMSHAMSSRILERLIPSADWASWESLREAGGDRRSWEGQGCPARVLEAMICDATRRINEDTPEKVECIKFVEGRSRFFLNHMEHQIWESNSNHVLRCCLKSCSETKEERLHDIVREAALYVIGWGQLNDHFEEPLISGFLQVLLTASRKCCGPTCDKLLKHLYAVALKKLRSSEETDNGTPSEAAPIPKIFSNDPLLRLLESCLIESSDKMFVKLYNSFFKGFVEALVKAKAHFALAKLISSCSSKLIFDEIYCSLTELIDMIVTNGQSKLLASVSERCCALSTKQGDFIQKMKMWAQCDKKEEKFTLCLLQLKKLPELSEELNIDYNGSVILQNLFKFNKPIKVVESFLSLDAETLRRIIEDQKGSWAVDSFTTSSTVGERSRLRLFGKLRGQFLQLASTKFGSRVFERIWAAVKFKERQQMITELDRTLLSSIPGRAVAKKIQLELYLTNKASWTSSNCNVGAAHEKQS